MTAITPLETLRQQIDAIDQDILRLINRRAALAMAVAQTKIAAGESDCFYRPDREALVLRAIRDTNPGPLSDDSAVRLFRELMSACLALEKPLQVAFLGPEGTFTQQAAYKHFGHAVHTVAAQSIDDIFRRVESGECQFGVVPIENSTEGVVSYTLDRFVTSPLKICGEVELRIHHNLMAQVARLSDITVVYSHQQSLAQCRRWLDSHLPHALRQPVSSNAEAARLAADGAGAAAIAGEIAAELYRLPILQRHIEDEADNTTRFLVIGYQTAARTGQDKTTLVLSTGNQPGALHRILAPFAQHGISLTRIESRPSRQGLWDYLFFIDIEGHQQDPIVAQALDALKPAVKMLKILGSFPKAAL